MGDAIEGCDRMNLSTIVRGGDRSRESLSRGCDRGWGVRESLIYIRVNVLVLNDAPFNISIFVSIMSV